MTGSPTLLYSIYRGATTALAPFAWRAVRRKLEAAGVPETRQQERLGHASQPRPDGRLIWFHAASVGESLSVLSLIARLGERLPDAEFLITSGTPTSAALLEKRMPPRCRHQYPPLDTGPAVERFLSHWHPDAGIFVESEIWPRTIVEAASHGIPLALLNARLSARSVDGWKKWPDTAQFVLGQFSVFVTQNARMAEDLRDMGADPARVRPGTNLKAMSAPLPVDQNALADIRDQIGARPVWIASSTHEGEEEAVLEAHRRLLARYPDLLLVLVPRHPERGDAVAAQIRDAGLEGARRTADQAVTKDTQVYLADTLGELGTWYALSPMVFLGGSLREIGGHNPFEPAQAGAAVITGPGTFNFSETFTPLIAMGGAAEVSDAAQLATALDRWLTDPKALDTARAAAARFVARQDSALEDVVETLCSELGLA
ncbi:3-deoxy-D-manno-octulosonic acid transferase [Lutimaribacter marinistellae]|uniref:3-deoxy-D-manno-octulosonic acid transferase n=1 Tax=Lutimaribacter marinistellae TaxID=1820329 RepID=A0ABV7TN24_9RHOB